MSNIKISQLPLGTTPLNGTEELPIVQAGDTVKVTTQDVADIAITLGGLVKNGLDTPQIIADVRANRPLGTLIGTLYIATDEHIIYRYNGAGWNPIGNVIQELISGNGINIDTTDPSYPIISIVDPTETQDNKIQDVPAYGTSQVKYPSVNAIKTYVDSLVVGLLDDRGNYTPGVSSPGAYPSTGGSGTAGAIKKGDIWFIDANGYLGTTPVVTGASVRALADNPGQTGANWNVLNVGLGYVSENVANKTATAGDITTYASSTIKYPSVKSIKDYVDATVAGNATLQTVTAGTNKNLTSSQNFQGTGAGDLSSGTDINAFGNDAGKGNVTVFNLNALGFQAAINNSGSNINALGSQASYHNTGDNINTLGIGAGSYNTQDNLNAFGYNAALNNSGADVNALGNLAAQANSGSNVSALGVSAAQNNSGSHVVAIGNSAAANNIQDNVIAIGEGAAVRNTGAGVVAMGGIPAQNNSGNGVVAIGNAATNNQGNYVVAIHDGSASDNLGNHVIAIGLAAGVSNGNHHVSLLGSNATASADDQLVFSNTAGYSAQISNTNLSTSNRTYELPDASGTIALTSDIPAGSTLQQVLTAGHSLTNGVNTQGTGAGTSNTGTDVNAFGTNAGAGNTFSSVNLLGNGATANSDSQTVFTSASGKAARISYNSLTANRNYTLPDNSGTLALTTDIPSASGWSLDGNSGTTPGTNFIGTTDASDVIFKANGVERMKIDNIYGDVYATNSFRAYSAGDTSIQAASGLGNGLAMLAQDATDKAYLFLSDGGAGSGQLKCTALTGNRVYQLPDANGTLALTSDIPTGSVLTTKVTLSSAQILSLSPVSGVTLIPAAGAGTIINPINFNLHYNAGTTVYTNNGININYASGGSYLVNTSFFLNQSFGLFTRNAGAPSNGVWYNGAINSDLVLKSNGTILGGDGTLDIYITYQIITL